jgi:hypothetical protein
METFFDTLRGYFEQEKEKIKTEISEHDFSAFFQHVISVYFFLHNFTTEQSALITTFKSIR